MPYESFNYVWLVNLKTETLSNRRFSFVITLHVLLISCLKRFFFITFLLQSRNIRLIFRHIDMFSTCVLWYAWRKLINLSFIYMYLLYILMMWYNGLLLFVLLFFLVCFFLVFCYLFWSILYLFCFVFWRELEMLTGKLFHKIPKRHSYLHAPVPEIERPLRNPTFRKSLQC